ncbi:MAG: chromate efflux transporter [Anaerolineaceae bacterium]|nr:chromate efflux transporter [Anaerolineaceae bacterium]
MYSDKHRNLKEVVLLFLKLGFTAFGGPAAHLAIMHDEVVKRRKWLDDDQFLDLVGATNLIPGPNSTEMIIHLSFLRAGWPGFFLGGISFILPAVLMVMGLAWSYQKYGAAPQVVWVLYAVKPVVIAIIIKALWFLGKQAVKDSLMGIAAASVLVLNLMGFDTLVLLFASGIIMMVIKNFHHIKANPPNLKGFIPLVFTSASSVISQLFNLPTLFLTFLKIGSVLYGGGYVLLAFLRSDFVTRLGWLTERQLIDAIAVGQVTPGPLFTTATFIGYILAGIPGAILATAGIFMPSFFFVAISNPYIPKMRQSVWFSSFLNGINAASLGLMAAVTIQLAQAVLIDPLSIILTISSLALVVFTQINTTWIILAAVLFGITRFLIGG